MMKKSIFTLLVFLLFGSAYAQTYTSYYRNHELWHGTDLHGGTDTFMGQVYIDGEVSDDLALELGGYDIENADNFVHIVAGNFAVMESGGVQYEHPVYFLTVYGEPGDKIIFKLYDHAHEQELDLVCEETHTFVNGGGSMNQIWHFFTPKNMVFAGYQDNQWANEANWAEETAEGLQPIGRLPKAAENVTIDANCLVESGEAAAITINPGYALTIEGNGLDNQIPFTLKDGAQLIAPANSTYSGTIEKVIQGYGTSARNNYYLIGIPFNNFNLATDFETSGMLYGDYDLYFFTQSAANAGSIDYDSEYDDSWWKGEWQNFKWYLDPDSEMGGAANFTDANQINKAYLYANRETTTLTFNGTFNSGEVVYTCLVNSSDWTGYQLVGNPLPCNASVVGGNGTTNRITGYYMMNETNRRDVIVVENPVVAPATALFAVATSGGAGTTRRVTFAPSTSEANVRSANSLITIEVLSDNGILEDRAYVRNYESEDLTKFSLSNEGTKIFIPQNGKKYAAVYAGEAKSMPLCFTSTEGGIHTITVNVENMNCSYLHLIDNVTGADIDLLRTPKYSFDANAGNYATRFKLVFDEQATNEIAENFAFISNGELVINNSGEATLQIMDITGRILSTENIQNCYSKNLNLSAGVYVVRLSNGNDVKAQKIVVE